MIILVIAQHNFITDAKGKKISVILPIKEYECMIEELVDVRLYDKSKSDKTPAISIDKAFKKIESKRNRK